MGLFDILSARTKCPHCGRDNDFDIQFKYGSPFQKRYCVGDRLDWSGARRPLEIHASVVADGVASCAACGHDECDFYVYIENAIIARVVPADGTFDFSKTEHATYVVLKE